MFDLFKEGFWVWKGLYQEPQLKKNESLTDHCISVLLLNQQLAFITASVGDVLNYHPDEDSPDSSEALSLDSKECSQVRLQTLIVQHRVDKRPVW